MLFTHIALITLLYSSLEASRGLREHSDTVKPLLIYFRFKLANRYFKNALIYTIEQYLPFIMPVPS